MSETAMAISCIDGLSEKRLWQAVLLATIQDWMWGPLSRKRQAEEYLFEDQRDFQTVCKSAGMDPDQIRFKLKRLRDRLVPKPRAHSALFQEASSPDLRTPVSFCDSPRRRPFSSQKVAPGMEASAVGAGWHLPSGADAPVPRDAPPCGPSFLSCGR